MKKLTAGIFATILGVTAMGAADAAVTSKGYVDSAVAAAKQAAIADAEKYIDATELKNSQDTQDASIKANADAIDAIEADYLKTADKTTLQTNIDNVSQALDDKQDKLQAAMFTKDGTGNVVTGITATNGQVTYTTANVATSDQLTTLSGRVDTAVGDISTIKTQQTTQDGKISALEAADTTFQTELSGVSATASEAAANAQTALDNAAAAQTAAEAAQSAADAAAATADANTQAIDNLGNTYVTKTVYDGHVEAQGQTNTQVQSSLDNLSANKADKTALNTLATKTELSAKADQSALTAEATTRAEADADLQEAIDAIESGVGGIETAGEGADGNYALTKKVETVDGKQITTYVWELIDREYVETDVTPNRQ